MKVQSPTIPKAENSQRPSGDWGSAAIVPGVGGWEGLEVALVGRRAWRQPRQASETWEVWVSECPQFFVFTFFFGPNNNCFLYWLYWVYDRSHSMMMANLAKQAPSYPSVVPVRTELHWSPMPRHRGNTTLCPRAGPCLRWMEQSTKREKRGRSFFWFKNVQDYVKCN